MRAEDSIYTGLWKDIQMLTEDYCYWEIADWEIGKLNCGPPIFES